MKKFLEIQETLTVKEKIELFQALYKDLAGHGINGDTELAHVNSYEAVVLSIPVVISLRPVFKLFTSVHEVPSHVSVFTVFSGGGACPP